MRDTSKYVVSVVGAAALVASVLTNALASQPSPKLSRPGRTQTVSGNLTVTGVIHANKNETVYGNLYTKGKAEIYKGLLIRANGLTVNAGGVKTDTLDASGALYATYRNDESVGPGYGGVVKLVPPANGDGPWASITLYATADGISASTAATRPPLSATSKRPLRPCAGSSRWPPCILKPAFFSRRSVATTSGNGGIRPIEDVSNCASSAAASRSASPCACLAVAATC